MSKPILCLDCGKSFKSARALKQHKLAKHSDDDESFADRAIQAGLDHAMGVDNQDYDWLVADGDC